MFESLFSSKKDQNLSDDELFTSLVNLIKEIGEREIVTKDTTFTEIGFDSVKYINLLLSLEELVGVDLETLVEKMDLSAIIIVEDLYNFLKQIKSR